MATPIRKIAHTVKTEAEFKEASLDSLLSMAAENRESLEQTISLLQELHTSGILEALTAMLQAKEKIAKIAVDQASRPEATTLINNLMSALGGLTKIQPEMTESLMAGVAQGLAEGNRALENPKKIGVFELIKVLKDMNVNRTLKFAIAFLKGLGKNL